MAGFVFVEAWQIQCCGDPFEVGESVSWLTVPSEDKLPFLSKKLGAKAAKVTHYEEHHVVDGPTETCVGIVRSIEAGFCMYDRVDGRRFEARTGSATFEPRTRTDGREPEDRRGDAQRIFVGYLVAVDGQDGALQADAIG